MHRAPNDFTTLIDNALANAPQAAEKAHKAMAASSVATMERMAYSGPATSAAVRAWAAANSQGCYVFAYVLFGEVLARRSNKLPTTKQLATDWPLGYWHNGKNYPWSESRKAAAAAAARESRVTR